MGEGNSSLGRGLPAANPVAIERWFGEGVRGAFSWGRKGLGEITVTSITASWNQHG